MFYELIKKYDIIVRKKLQNVINKGKSRTLLSATCTHRTRLIEQVAYH